MILAQADITTTSPVAVYSVPASKSSVISTILLCNKSSANTTFRLAFCKNTNAISSAQYAYYDTPVSANDTIVLEFTALQLASNDRILVQNSSRALTVQIFGLET